MTKRAETGGVSAGAAVQELAPRWAWGDLSGFEVRHGYLPAPVCSLTDAVYALRGATMLVVFARLEDVSAAPYLVVVCGERGEGCWCELISVTAATPLAAWKDFRRTLAARISQMGDLLLAAFPGEGPE